MARCAEGANHEGAPEPVCALCYQKVLNDYRTAREQLQRERKENDQLRADLEDALARISSAVDQLEVTL